MPRKFVQSLGYAQKGIRHSIKSQRNIRIHFTVAALTVALGFYFRLSLIEFIFIAIMISMVIVAEMLNTAIEETVNLFTPGHHPRATLAKDTAAGAVLFSVICAIIVGCLIFIPHLAGLGR